jgi:hypothetical protein
MVSVGGVPAPLLQRPVIIELSIHNHHQLPLLAEGLIVTTAVPSKGQHHR